MSVELVLARIAELDRVFRAPSAAPTTTSTTAAPSTFAATLAGQGLATGNLASPLALGQTTATGFNAAVGDGTAGGRALAAAQAEVGVAEQPPGSNDAPRIAEYRTATAGSGIGPWCAYFTSWAARQAGAPVGEAGQGFGSVDALYAWAQRTGRATPAATGATPSPGDLIAWDEHIGIVESVNPDGSMTTIEGNSSNAVTRRTHGPGGDGAVGYVRLG